VELSASGASWAIASPHVAATEAGAEAFARGGNAIDAALHAATALAVAYPHMCGVGGDLFALVQRPDGEALAVASSGRAPASAEPNHVRRVHASMPVRGPIPITVPGAIAGWRTVHASGAVLPWPAAFERAIALAFDGVEVSRSLAEILSAPDAPHASDPGLAALFYPGGLPAPLGARVRQAALGATLRAIAERGPDALYRGDVGRAYVEGLRAAGSSITATDLATHEAVVLPPLRTPFRDVHVSVAPPNSQGFALLEIFALAERLGLDPDPHGPDAGALAHVFAAAARDRDRHLADPDHMLVHPSTLLDDGHIAALGDEVRASAVARPSPGGDTVALVTADAGGWAVSLIQSLFWDFGSGICEPETGIVAQNRGTCFTLEPDHPNAFAPGKRPAHTLMPVLVHDDRGLVGVAGSMGGYGQPQINAQTLVHSFARGAPPADAVAAPRWRVGRPEDDGDPGPWAVVERGVPSVARDAIRAAGFRVEDVSARTEALGHAHLIRLGGDGLEAGSDPRADGGALAG
jgi:gamma-glutamyltranspeptidase